MIVAAAIRLEGSVYHLPPPARHADIRRWAQAEAHSRMRQPIEGVYGFLTEKGAFLTRAEAAVHVLECGQPLLCGTISPMGLFSEDLW